MHHEFGGQASTFGEFLKLLRKRVPLTQRELGDRVGYSESQINRLEHGSRMPDRDIVSEGFITALGLGDRPELAARLLALARAARTHPGSAIPGSGLGHNLPNALTSFVGRAGEIDDVTEVMAQERLVSLVGPGGCGKTRLALEVARRVRADYADGVWFIDLANVTDLASVVSATADGLKLTLLRSPPTVEAVIAVLRERHMLLILDNCELAAEVCAQFAEHLLSACAQVHILATSREPLHVLGEWQWSVPALKLPEGSDLERPVEALIEFEAVRLFIERAQSVGRLRSEALTRPVVLRVINICQRLDGMPLAIELAAARASTLGVDEIQSRLDDRFKLLVSNRPTINTRQQSLLTTIEWSINMLSLRERTLLARLSIFVSGWTLAAAEAVCADGPDSHELLTRAEIVNVLSALIDKSLVNRIEAQDQALAIERASDALGPEAAGTAGTARLGSAAETSVRYGMLESIREFARDELGIRTMTSEAAKLARRHATWCLGWVEEVEDNLFGRDQVAWLKRLDHERDNIRAALGYYIAQGQAEGARRLAGSLRRFWQTRGRAMEGRTWLDRALALRGDASDQANTKAFFTAATLANYQGDIAARDPLLERAITYAKRTGDPWLIGQVLGGIVSGPHSGAAYERSKLNLMALLANARALSNDWLIGNALHKLATLERDHGDFRVARQLFSESLAHLDGAGDTIYSMLTLMWLGNIALNLGDTGAAEAHYAAALELVGQSGVEYAEHIGIWTCLRGLAELAARDRQALRMAALLGATQAEQESLGGMPNLWFPLLTMEDGLAYYKDVSGAPGTSLDDAAYRAAWRDGLALTLEEAIQLALKHDSEDEAAA